MLSLERGEEAGKEGAFVPPPTVLWHVTYPGVPLLWLQVMGAVVDVEFDDMEGVPDILNALHVKVRRLRCVSRGRRRGEIYVVFTPTLADGARGLACRPGATQWQCSQI